VSDPAGTWSDQRYLRDVQYRDDRNLAARQAIYAYQQPRVDVWAWTLGLAGMDGGETVLDVGCGNGRYLRTLRQGGHRGRTVGLDPSAGMLRGVVAEEPSRPVVLGDAQTLPFRTGSADVALAMHMLYHVPSPELAVRELRRVTRPGGTVLVLLNGADHLLELRALLAVEGVGRPERFDVERGRALLTPVFDRIELHTLHTELVVPEVAPVRAYLESMIGVDTQPRVALLEAATAAVAEQIRTAGAFRTRTSSGCFVCS
jgi:SAM-dependent methyltransferase